MIPGVKRRISFLFTIAALLLFGLPSLFPAGQSDDTGVREVEFVLEYPDGTRAGAHLLVRAASAAEAEAAALETLRVLEPAAAEGATPHGHDHDLSASAALESDTASAQEASEREPWGWLWDDDELPVPVHYNPSGALEHFSVADVRMALDVWSDVPGSRFAFTYAGETTLPASLNVSGRDGENVIAWQGLGCDEESCVLGLTTKSFESHEVDISLNTHPDANLGDGSDGTYDALTVLLHELGHMAGLEHSCTADGPCSDEQHDAVMFHSYSGVRHDLSEDDIAALAAHYPADDGVASSMPLDPPGEHDDAASSVAIQLDPGWNLATLMPLGIEPVMSELTCVQAVYAYDEQQGWLRWIRGLDAAYQTLDVLRDGEAYWVLAEDSCTGVFH